VVREPSWSDLKLVALAQGIPFIGFGIMDNAILIIAGDAIDHSLGVVLGISTMCAAAIGNIVSDVAGVMLGTVVEDFCARLGLPRPSLSSAQRQLRSVRFAGQFGICVGLVIGCIIGMFPLLFIDSEHIQKLKQDASINNMFTDIVTEARGLIGAGHTCLFLVVDSETSTSPLIFGVGNKPKKSSSISHNNLEDDNGYLYGKYINDKTGKRNSIRMPLGRGIVSRAALSGEAVNVYE
jgi:tRNA-specific adenosine deaminase 1